MLMMKLAEAHVATENVLIEFHSCQVYRECLIVNAAQQHMLTPDPTHLCVPCGSPMTPVSCKCCLCWEEPHMCTRSIPHNSKHTIDSTMVFAAGNAIGSTQLHACNANHLYLTGC
jgi:hypothetical protein